MHEQAYPRAAERLGTVTLDPPSPIVAGSVGQWTLTLTVGSLGIDEGGTIKVCQRFASDWEPSQFDRPTESGYTTVTTTGAAGCGRTTSERARPAVDAVGCDRRVRRLAGAGRHGDDRPR
jgi:hypothetical protein